MRKSILFYSLLFVFAFSYGNTNLESTELIKNVNEIHKEKVVKQSEVKNLKVEVTKNLDECSITLTGRIGYNSTYMSVSITTTAETCEEAEDMAWAALNRQYQRLKAFVDSQ